MNAWRTDPVLRHAFDALADPVLVADEESRYVDANIAACNLLGYTQEELLSKRVADVVASPPQWTTAEYECYLQEGRWEGGVTLRCKDGGLVSATARSRILDLPNSHRAYLSVLSPDNATTRSVSGDT